jgi:type II secretory pathway predicted ATPase ExeA
MTATAADWKRYYGFTRTPFSKRIAPTQAFASPGHQEAAARIRWIIDEQAIGVVTGEVGVGKTLAARAAVADLDACRHTVIYVANPAAGARGLHQQLAYALGVAPRFHRGALIAQTADLLTRERDERDKHVALIIDEAHLLDADQLEQVRLLTNADMDAVTPLAIVLLGQPTLRRVLRRGSYAALDQRIAVRYQLPPLDAAASADYLRHHLAVAGRSDPLFADDATAAIAHAARGLPRQIGNVTCSTPRATATSRRGCRRPSRRSSRAGSAGRRRCDPASPSSVVVRAPSARSCRRGRVPVRPRPAGSSWRRSPAPCGRAARVRVTLSTRTIPSPSR